MTTAQRVHAYHDLVDGQITLARYKQLLAEHSCPECGSTNVAPEEQHSEDRDVGYSETRTVGRCMACGYVGDGEDFEVKR